MTREEAIKILKDMEFHMEERLDAEAFCEAYNMAVAALSAEPCEDAVSRKALLDLAYTIETDDYSGNDIYDVVSVDDIKDLPSVQPKEKVGEWEYTGDFLDEGMNKCSLCGFELDVSVNAHFCPNCGAKMGRKRG